MSQGGTISIFLCGDVMTGRGIDQILPNPVDPVLHESYIHDARGYVLLAEKANGPVSRPVTFDYIWGDALDELNRAAVDLRVINLETSITTSRKRLRGKGIHYRMHPKNIGALTAARIDACALGNNHLLDWGFKGLKETLSVLDEVAISRSGAGNNLDEAMAPAVLPVTDKGRALVFSFGSRTSGIPEAWGATADQAGVFLLEDLSEATATRIASHMRQFQQPNDALLASVHWGGNWGYEVPDEQIAFAHRLIDEGVAVVHGHSSHHVKGIEVYRNRLILYGCGDFITDYEGITGHEMFRGDLAMMYLVEVCSASGELISLRMIPMQMRRLQLNHARAADARWLNTLLNRLGPCFGTQTHLSADNSLQLVW